MVQLFKDNYEMGLGGSGAKAEDGTSFGIMPKED
jgi:hypothetical protein